MAYHTLLRSHWARPGKTSCRVTEARHRPLLCKMSAYRVNPDGAKRRQIFDHFNKSGDRVKLLTLYALV